MKHEDGRAEQRNWLVRQWNRLRRGRWRDVIIGQVGEGATNVVIGKNNAQINVSGRNLTLPIWLITRIYQRVVNRCRDWFFKLAK